MSRKHSLFAATLAVTMAACDTGDDDPERPDDVSEFPRHETLFTTGKQWGDYAVFNPFRGSDSATGIAGLVYETLFLYDPLTGELEPWLAESGEWISDNEYQINLREGIEWSDGTPFTAEDVVFTIELREFDTIDWSPINEWVDEVTATDDLTVNVTFSDPRAGEWDNFLYGRWIGPAHIYQDIRDEDIVNEPGDGDRLVGTGSYLYHSHEAATVLRLERNEDWWGIEAKGLEMGPRYIVDWSNASHNDIARQELVQGNIDLSNNFLPAEVLDDPNIEAYRDSPPYMIAWNTAYLVPNHDREPMDDAAFRRAMAFAINVQDILDLAFAGLVEGANPTGLLPSWVDLGMVDQSVVDEHGFSYDPDEANSILDAAGYAYDGDWRTTPGGDEIELSVIVPVGWSDWEIGAEVIAESLQAVGLNVVADFPDSDTLNEMRDNGDYDLVVNNWTQQSNTPWTLYDYLFQLPVRDLQVNANFHRYENPEAWSLTGQLGGISIDDRDAFDPVHSQLQEIALQEMPAIPMWYNGLWSQWNTTYWTNWPTDAQQGPLPSTWNNVWEMRAIYTLAQLEPTGAE
jgi:peptide/nickel transport system substrate-binding protein